MSFRSTVLALISILLMLPSCFWGQDERPTQPYELPTHPLHSAPVPDIPGDPEIRKAIYVAIMQKNFLSAENQLVELIEQIPNSPELLVLLGRVLFTDGKYLNAAVAFKKAEKLTPLKEEDHFTVAMSFVILNRKDWARLELEKLAQLNIKNARYPYWLARLDYDDGKYDSAVERLKDALKLDPDFVRAYDNLGLSYEGLGKFEDAFKSYEMANRLNRQQAEKSAWPPLDFGILLLNRGDLSEAESYLNEAVGYAPNFPQARFQLGTLLEKQKKYPEAIQELKTAASLDPSYPEPHYVLARIYRANKDLKSAEEEVKTFQDLKQKRQKHP